MAVASVLVVDGDTHALASARAVLAGAGYNTREASGGWRALEGFSATPPDVLVTEILMPDGDGIELIAAVKRSHRQVRIIAVTGRRMLGKLDLLDLASKLGADATLEKPFRPEVLLATVTVLVGLSGRPPSS